MANLTTRFFGLELKSPLIAASSSMTGNLEQIKKLADAGAGAVVLKSIFEEEIQHQLQKELKYQSSLNSDPEYMDYFDYVIKDESLTNYIQLIKSAKKETNIPIIASINCKSAGEWISYAKKIEAAGADALELNLFIVPSNEDKSSEQNELFYYDTITKVTEAISIPVSVKISHYFSNLATVAKNISEMNISGITIFNRFFAPDINIDRKMIVEAQAYSQPTEYLLPLRWTGILSDKIKCDLAATTGIHNSETAIKFLLAGASAVQVATAIYMYGVESIALINRGIESWMNKNNYNSIEDFKGSLSLMKADNAVAYERVQFMKYFGSVKF